MLRYIDIHIKEKLNVEKLAARAGFSPYHFCRVFQWEVGYSLMEYVRNRRLFYAASELATGRKIVDISVDYSFETHSGFTKAFSRYFGCSPEKYREHASFDVPKLPILKKTKQYVSGGIVMEPKMIKKPAITIAGFSIKTKTKDGENFKAIPQFWQDYCTDGRQEKIHKESFLKSREEYGACFPENPGNGEFEYVIGLEVKDGHDIPKSYHVCTIPEALYAVFTTPPVDNDANFSSTIQGTWKYIFSEWFPASGYEFAPNAVDFEFYDERCMAETNKVMDIYIPVVKK
ncbi:MAG: AraC family transcriptional regulator [Treponema sp.]|nr:AraC family transcriptional regulator [Treponema sp.]